MPGRKISVFTFGVVVLLTAGVFLFVGATSEPAEEAAYSHNHSEQEAADPASVEETVAPESVGAVSSALENDSSESVPGDTPVGTSVPDDIGSEGLAEDTALEEVSEDAAVSDIKKQEIQPRSYETTLALEVHRLTNEEREERGLAPLIYDAELAGVAKHHSEDMLKRDYFDHMSSYGCDTKCRLEEGGYGAAAWAENIAWRLDSDLPGAKELAEHFFESWLDSPEHQVNIVSENVTHEGIGVARTGDRVYITADFALPE